ncbi:MAG: DinB family protein [Dehalococcoidales bacterium]|jgi:hypothetical protein
MEWQQLIMDIYGRISQELEKVLDGLTVDELNQSPCPDCNSIGWLAWHLTRTQDRAIEDLMGEEQLWVKDEWYAKFNRAPDPTDTGFGHSLEDVAAFKSPDSKTLLEYNSAVFEQTKRYINNKLSETDLDRKFENPTYPHVPTVRPRLIGVINDNMQHVGQATYVRGMLKGQGWYGR